MTDEVREEYGRSPVAEAPLPLPLDFEAYYLTNQEAFHEYALAILHTNDRAEKAVHRAFLEILRHWDGLLTEPDLQEQIWQIMRRVVIGELIEGLRENLTTMDSGIGLYPALGKLPLVSSTPSSCATSPSTTPRTSPGTWASRPAPSITTAARPRNASPLSTAAPPGRSRKRKPCEHLGEGIR